MESTGLLPILRQNLEGLGVLSGELILIFGSIVMLIAGVFGLQKKYGVFLYALIIVLALVFKTDTTGVFFGGDMEWTDLGNRVQSLLLLVSLSLLLFKSFWKRKREYYFMVLAILAGSLLMTSARNLLIVFLSIELASLPAYLATAFLFKKRSYEAALKYLLTGIVSSAVMLYGLSLIYGTTGSLLPEYTAALTMPALVGWSLFLVGILFKVSAFPVHFWVPNTYQLAPTELVAFFSVVPKVGGFVLLMNLFSPLANDWLHGVLLVAAILSIVVGTFSALQQEQVKRMLAYGAIAHSGFLLPLTFIAGSTAQASFLFYTVVYAVMNVAAFYFVSCYEQSGELKFTGLSGLGVKSPLTAAAMVVVMIALVGLPPTAGFSIKLLLFSAVWQAYELTGNYLHLAFVVVGILSSAVSLFFYLRVPYYSFLVPEVGKRVQVENWRMTSFMLFFALSLILIFVGPNIFDNFIFSNP